MFLLCSSQDPARKLAIVDHRRGAALGRIAEMRDDLGTTADHSATPSAVVGRVERSATRHLFGPAEARRVTLRSTRPTTYPDAMPDYRRNRVPGATYFFTVNLRDRRSDLLVTHIDALREAVRGVRPGNCRFASTPGSSCRSTCTACGPFPKAIATFPTAGAGSKPRSRNHCPIPGNDRRLRFERAIAESGSAAIGSTRSATIGTMRPIWTTSTSTR
jgi:hypothetical protein